MTSKCRTTEGCLRTQGRFSWNGNRFETSNVIISILACSQRYWKTLGLDALAATRSYNFSTAELFYEIKYKGKYDPFRLLNERTINWAAFMSSTFSVILFSCLIELERCLSSLLTSSALIFPKCGSFPYFLFFPLFFWWFVSKSWTADAYNTLLNFPSLRHLLTHLFWSGR